jgi:uncharacterized membrane protein
MDSLFVSFFKYKPFLFHKGTLAFESSLPSWSLWLLAAGLAAITLALYRKRFAVSVSPTLPVWKRTALVSLRSLFFALLVTVLFRPVLHVSTVLPRENIAAILIDDSKSMAIQDTGQQSRLDAVKQVLNPKGGTLLADVERRFQTRLFRFSRDIKRLNSLEELQPEGTGTSLEASLESVLKEFGPAPLASVVLFTDGADNVSKNLKSVLSQYQSRKIAVNVVAVGQTNLERDVELVQVSSPEKILPDSIVTAVVSLRNTGYSGKKVVVEVRESGKLVHSVGVTLGGKDEAQLVELNLAPKGKGLKSYTVSVAPQPGEMITLNNSQELLLNVEDSKPKILYLEGTPRWEFKFIREALQPDKNLQLLSLLRTSGNKFYRQGIETEDNLASGFPSAKEELFQYKGLMIGSIEASFFTAEQLKMIGDFVSERGGGLMMLGGRHSFDAGKYGTTSIADLLPVNLGQKATGSSFVVAPVKFKLSSYGKTHLVTRLVVDERENEKRWNALPQIGEFNWITSVKPGAIVLASGDGSYGNAILLAAHRYGRGRVMAFMAASSWRWQMEMPHEDDSHEIFWRQALRWLVSSSPDPVSLELDRSVYQQEDIVTFNVEVNDPSFDRLNDAEVVARVTSPAGGRTDVPLKWIVRKDGVYAGEWRPSEKGNYRVEVSATRQGKDIGRAEQFFLVGESNAEFYGAGQNKPLLSRIAAETGGKYYTLDGLKDLPEEMTYTEHPGSIPRALPLWDMPILLFLFCLFLIAEWALRKRQGMA